MVLLGVDGGNTKTIALVAGADGTVVGAGRGGCGDVHGVVPALRAIDEIVGAVDAALRQAGARREDVGGALFSLAGADWDEDFALIARELEARLGLGPPTLVNDAVGAIRCGTPDGVGLAVVCGTGGVVGARGRDGRVFHLGFWPGETAGAGDLGRAALRAVYEAGLGAAAETALRERALELYGADDVIELMHRFNSLEAFDPPDVTRLARVVLDEADAGDAVARSIVAEQGHRLGTFASVAAVHAGLGERFTVVLCGGVMRHPSPLLVDAVLACLPAAVEPVRARVEPAVGALLGAFDAAGLAVDGDRLAASLPDPALFAT